MIKFQKLNFSDMGQVTGGKTELICLKIGRKKVSTISQLGPSVRPTNTVFRIFEICSDYELITERKLKYLKFFS